MTLADDLRAARSLIDTPEKLAAVGSVREACRAATSGDRERDSAAFLAFMATPGDDRFVLERGNSYVRVAFDSIPDRFDRAIQTAEQSQS
jgi:hypothetical protein